MITKSKNTELLLLLSLKMKTSDNKGFIFTQ